VPPSLDDGAALAQALPGVSIPQAVGAMRNLAAGLEQFTVEALGKSFRVFRLGEAEHYEVAVIAGAVST
jgi:hypothetical protein